MLILSAADVRRALPMPEAVAAMKRAFAALSDGRASVPARIHLGVPRNRGISLIMPSLLDAAEPADQALAVKVVSLFDQNAARGLARIQAAVVVLDPATGQPLALLEGATLTAIRTAAGSGAATDLLARQESETLALLGAGVQARDHVRAMCAVRPIREIRVFSPSPHKVAALIDELSAEADVPARLLAAATARAAVYGADIVCCTTTSREPVFDDKDLLPGTHVNAVGSYQPTVREVPGETVARALVVVDSRAAAWEEAGDLIQPLRAGLVDHDIVHAELGELVLGQKTGRTHRDQVTLYKSVGIAIQDAAAAKAALAHAERLGLGTRVPW